MTILKETEKHHDVLGSIRFDNGKGDRKTGMDDYVPYWVARPDGWLSDEAEFLISGDASGPASDSLDRAISAFNSLEKIKREGEAFILENFINDVPLEQNNAHFDINLLWIDCQQTKTIAVFNWDGYTYVKWEAILDETNNIISLQEKTW